MPKIAPAFACHPGIRTANRATGGCCFPVRGPNSRSKTLSVRPCTLRHQTPILCRADHLTGVATCHGMTGQMCVEQVVKCRGILRLPGRAPQGRPKGERVRHRHRVYVQSDTQRQPSLGRPSTSAPPDTVDGVTELKPVIYVTERECGAHVREFHTVIRSGMEAVTPPGAAV